MEKVEITWKSAFKVATATVIVSLVLVVSIFLAFRLISDIAEEENNHIDAYKKCMEKYANHPMKEQAQSVCEEKFLNL